MPAATRTVPVTVSRVTRGSLLDTKLVVTFVDVTATPLSVSLTRTLATATPPAAEVTLPESSFATIAPALTGTVTVAFAQLVGALVSQMR